jgi:hypothetical protein
VKKGITKHCGCKINKNKQDLTGNKYGRLTVISFSCKKDKRSYWNCQCECGNYTVIDNYKLLSGHTKSCGCLAKESIRKIGKEYQLSNPPKRIKHGLCHKTLYNSWHSMLYRCENENDPRYYDYGGRGIQVCREWHDIKLFYEWAIQNGYKEGLSIDRIDVNGNYEPSNCRWADRITQQNNMRKNRLLVVNGETKTVANWARAYGIDYGVLMSRLQRGWNEEKALKSPVIHRHKST